VQIVSIKSDLARWTKDLTDAARQQVPFALANALNDCARQAVVEYRAALPKIFDRPTPFTLNSAYAYGSARKDNLQATVALRFTAPKGTPAEKYLAPQIEGGERHMKRFERRMAANMPGIGQMIPGRDASLDAYGNVSRGEIQKILSQLRMSGENNVSDATLRRLRRKKLLVKTARGDSQYFIARSKQGGALGIWKLLSKGHVGPVFFFARRPPHYTKHLDFAGLITASYGRHIEEAFRTRLALALATAR
jgi:hypothetical protein